MLSGSTALPPSCQPAPDLGGPLPAAALVPSPTPDAACPWLQDRGRSGPSHKVRPSSLMGQHSQVLAQATSQSTLSPQCVLCVAARGALRCSPSCSDPPRLLTPRGKAAKSFPDLRGWSPVTRPTNTPGSSHTGLLVFQDVPSTCPYFLTPSQLHTAAPSYPVGLLQGHPGPCPTARPMTLPLTRPAQLPCLPGLSSGH